MKTDADLIKSLGTDEKAAETLEPVIGKRLSAEAIRKFRERGIPWRYRPAVHRFFRSMRKRPPVDFLESRRPAA